MTADLGSLRVEIETQWELSPAGRLVRVREASGGPPPDVVVAGDPLRWIVAVSERVPDGIARELIAVTDRSVPDEPGAVTLARRVLAPATSTAPGPCYLVPPGVRATPPASGRLVRSDQGRPRSLPAAGADWSTEEWAALMDGRLGPWAAMIEHDHVAALCHCARLAPYGAEAGVWTEPAYRGRGYAAAVTAAWAAVLAGGGRRLFYSTWAANRSSQRVAARLQLPCIGHLWKITSAG